jgi:hypothetical protein
MSRNRALTVGALLSPALSEEMNGVKPSATRSGVDGTVGQSSKDDEIFLFPNTRLFRHASSAARCLRFAKG